MLVAMVRAAANVAAREVNRERIVFMLPIFERFIRPVVRAATARKRSGGKPALFVLERVEKIARFLLAHLAGLAMGFFRLGRFVLALVRAGIGLRVALRLALRRLRLLALLDRKSVV